MSKLISSGIIVKFGDRYVLGHVTGHDTFDIFKGRADEGETYIQTALRECQEESSLVFTEDQLTFLGYHSYIPKKDLTLFITRVDELSMNDLKCVTHFENGKAEMDYYATFDFDEMLSKVGKSMRKVLDSLKTEIESF